MTPVRRRASFLLAAAALVLALAAAPAHAAAAPPTSRPGPLAQGIAWLAQLLLAAETPAQDTAGCPVVDGRPTCARGGGVEYIQLTPRITRGCAIDPIGGVLTC